MLSEVPLRLGTHRERARGGANPGSAGQGSGRGGGGGWLPVVLSGVAIVAGNAHFVRSWIPMDRHPVSGPEGCGPQTQGVVVTNRLPTVLHSMWTPSRAVEHHSFPIYSSGIYR